MMKFNHKLIRSPNDLQQALIEIENPVKFRDAMIDFLCNVDRESAYYILGKALYGFYDHVTYETTVPIIQKPLIQNGRIPKNAT